MSGGHGIRTDSGSGLADNDLGKAADPFGTNSGTVGGETAAMPPALREVVSAWPALPEATRERILGLARGAGAD